MNKPIFLTLFALVLLVSCNKDQSAVKKLDGTWTMTEYEYTFGGETFVLEKTDQFQNEMTFNNCKLKNNEWCMMTDYQVNNGVGTESNRDFQVKNDGTTLVVLDPQNPEPGANTIEYQIVELDKDQLILDTDINGDHHIIRMKPKGE